MTHAAIWAKIDKVAEILGKTPSGLAIACHMDATSFNKSKRFTAHGQPRWPSVGTVSKIVELAGITDEEFVRL